MKESLGLNCMLNYNMNLTKKQKLKYDLMLETNYVLLKCDEWKFIETDENNIESMSLSWILSIQPTLDLFGLRHDAYPQGSLSANRHYYECLRNYLGGSFPNTSEYNFFRSCLGNMIRLRRDDSSPTRSYLFGSYYKNFRALGSRDPKDYRIISISLRHSASALWILCEESFGSISELLKNSINSFLLFVQNYLSKNQDWQTDNYKHLTLASIINTCKAIINKFPDQNFIPQTQEIKKACETEIFSNDCITQSIEGEYEWKLPDIKKFKMAKYEYYLTLQRHLI